MGWLFHVSDPMGGAAGEAYANTLASPGMPPAHVLAREAIQNSVDAGNGNKVAVRFRSDSLSGARKATFVEAAGLADVAARTEDVVDPLELLPRLQLVLHRRAHTQHDARRVVA